MQKQTTRQDQASPFFDLLAEADEIRIRELDAEPSGSTSLDKVLTDFESEDSGRRSFFVSIKKNPPPAPVAPTPDPAQRAHLLQSAKVLLDYGDYLLARNIYSFLLKQQIRDAKALEGLGVCLFRLGEGTSAKKCFQALWEMEPRESWLVWLGICFAGEGNDATAVQHFFRVKSPETLPQNLRFDFFKESGNCHTRLGHLEKAMAAYQKALEINPNSDTLYVNLGTLEMQRDSLDDAEIYYDKATRLNSKSARGYCGLGLVAIARQQVDRATTLFEKTLELDTQNTVAIYQLLSFAQTRDEYQRVRSHLNQFLVKEPKNLEIRYLLATCLYKESDWVNCEREIDRILSQDPCHAKSLKLKQELSHNRHQTGGLR